METLQLVFDMVLLIWQLSVDSGFWYPLAWFLLISETMMIFCYLYKECMNL